MKAKKVVPQERDPRLKGLKQFKDLPVVAKIPDPPEKRHYPEYPVTPTDVEPDKFPVIKQADILAYLNVESVYKTARADFERRRTMLLFQLVMLSRVESGHWEIKLSQDRESFSVTQPCTCCGATGDVNAV